MSGEVDEAESTLPQPLSARMAERLARSDGSILRGRGPEAQQVRRDLLEGATIAIVGVGYPGKRFIYERAAELGVRLALIDHRGHWGEQLVSEGIAAAFVPADLYVHVPNQVQAMLAGLAALDMAFDGVCTFWEESGPVAARLAKALNLPGNAPEAADRARSKRLTLLATEAAGMPTPSFAPIEPVGTLDLMPASVGFPAVVKPEFGSSAIGVYRVDSEDQLRATLAVIEPILLPLNPDGNFSVYGSTFLVEEYLDGTEFDIDLLFSEGRCVYSAIAENWPTDEPFFFETGLHAPSDYPNDRLEEMMDLAVRGAQALGLELGALHVEVKYTSRGPRIVEINARMGGSTIRDMNLKVHGVDLVEEHLMATVGIPIRPIASDQPMCGVANMMIYADRTATIASTDFVERFASDPRVFYAAPAIEPGQRVQCAADGFPTLLMEVALRDVNAQAAVDAIRDLAGSVTISYR
jgi:biotin carboxylase